MPLEPKKSRIVLFFVVGFGLALLMAGLKALFAWIAHTYAYSVPWIGGFLKSIEITEISNLVVFAILGAGIGAATLLLPASWSNKIKLAFLLALSPFVFSASYMMQQHLWIQQVANSGNVSYREAKTVTNTYLKRETGKSGFFGFYPFSTQLAELPTRLEVLRSEQSVNPNKLLTQELSSYDDPRADLAAYVFERVGWLIRFMYMTIAALTAVIYYFKGALWADSRQAGNRQSSGKRVVLGSSTIVTQQVSPIATKDPTAKRPIWKRKATKGKAAKGKATKKKVTKSKISKPKVSDSRASDAKTSNVKPSNAKPSNAKASEPKMRKPLIGKPSNSSSSSASTSGPGANSAPTPAQPAQTPTPRQNEPRTEPITNDFPRDNH